ncbi:MAG: hypothetical protein RMJ87_09920 [Cytophagales bacterium]|nr:hypothetical protein [Bernardetiaceae bacterium]MDW8205334.1 hypothetical protein [Cytophagales bacterium]
MIVFIDGKKISTVGKEKSGNLLGQGVFAVLGKKASSELRIEKLPALSPFSYKPAQQQHLTRFAR